MRPRFGTRGDRLRGRTRLDQVQDGRIHEGAHRRGVRRAHFGAHRMEHLCRAGRNPHRGHVVPARHRGRLLHLRRAALRNHRPLDGHPHDAGQPGTHPREARRPAETPVRLRIAAARGRGAPYGRAPRQRPEGAHLVALVDIGFVGKDTLDDVDFEDYYELLDLEIGKCYFAVAAYPEYRDKVFNRRKKIASKYTNVAKKYFASKQEDVEIIKLEGSVELGPVTGISDAIVDIVETGSTLKANGLEVIEKVSDISTRMIVNKVAFKFKKDEIMNIVNQLEKVIGGNQNA